jgi:hypothetical protein
MVICGIGNFDGVQVKEETKHHVTWHKCKYSSIKSHIENESYSMFVFGIMKARCWTVDIKVFTVTRDGCNTCKHNIAAATEKAKIEANKRLMEKSCLKFRVTLCVAMSNPGRRILMGRRESILKRIMTSTSRHST